jgi:thioredoxin 1
MNVKIIPSAGNVLLDFYADWCEPCKWVIPILAEIEKHFGSKIKIEKVDIDANPEFAKNLHILSVPTLILFVNGKEAWRKRGFDAAEVMIRDIEDVFASTSPASGT